MAAIERAPTTLVSVTKNHLDEVTDVTIVQADVDAQPLVTTHSKKKS